MERKENILQVYWTQKIGPHYRNGGRMISEEITREAAGRGEYCQVETDRDPGVMPVSHFFEMQRMKSEMERIIQEANSK